MLTLKRQQLDGGSDRTVAAPDGTAEQETAGQGAVTLTDLLTKPGETGET